MPHDYNATVNQNTSLFDAFKQLTVGREQNRGTLEISKWDKGKAVELKCSQHHFYSGKVKVPEKDVADLRQAVNRAIAEKLSNVKIGCYGRATTSEQVVKFDELVDSIQNLVSVSTTDKNPLLRKDIEKVIVNTEDALDQLSKLSVDQLLNYTVEMDQETGKVVVKLPEQQQSAAPQNAQPGGQPEVQEQGRTLERAYAQTDYTAAMKEILDDTRLKDDALVFFTDKTRASLGCGDMEQARGLSAREKTRESAAMRAELYKFAKKELSTCGDEGTENLKMISDILLGSPGSKTGASPLTKGDLADVKLLIDAAKVGENAGAHEVKGKGAPKFSELNARQQVFLRREAREYKAWFEATDAQYHKVNGKSITAKEVDLKTELRNWKLKKALDPAYQDQVCQLFGNVLEPRQANGQLGAAEPSTQETVGKLGGDGKSARHHASLKFSDKVVGYQIAADATFFGGTVIKDGQEEAHFKDLPAMNLAYMIKKGYIEPVAIRTDKKTNKTIEIPVTPENFESMKEDTIKYRYAVDPETGLQKVNTWYGMALPTYCSTDGGVPTGDGNSELSWMIFTGATAFGGGNGSTANIDRGGFLTAVSNRQGNPLNLADKTQRANANLLFDEIIHACKQLTNKKSEYAFLQEEARVHFGAKPPHTGGKATKWANLMFFLTFKADFKNDPKAEFKKWVDFVKADNYETEMAEALKDFQTLTRFQKRGWVQLAKSLGLDAAIEANPGGNYFANPPDVTLDLEGETIQTDGGDLLFFHFAHSKTNKEHEAVNAAFQKAKHASAA